MPEATAAPPRSRFAVFEDAISVGALVLMAAIPITEALIRPVYPTGIPGSFMWVQHLTLWVAFLGAAVASRRGELLALSAGPSMVSEVWRPRLLSLSGAVGVVVSVVLSYASVVLTRAEWEGGRELALGVPVWAAVAVMPVGFGLIAWRLCGGSRPHGAGGRRSSASRSPCCSTRGSPGGTSPETASNGPCSPSS